jgi:hypothetical protein
MDNMDLSMSSTIRCVILGNLIFLPIWKPHLLELDSRGGLFHAHVWQLMLGGFARTIYQSTYTCLFLWPGPRLLTLQLRDSVKTVAWLTAEAAVPILSVRIHSFPL